MFRLCRRALAGQAKVFLPDFAQGKHRMELDQPAIHFKFREHLYPLSDAEKEAFVLEPKIGVDHLYEAHLGSKDRYAEIIFLLIATQYKVPE